MTTTTPKNSPANKSTTAGASLVPDLKKHTKGVVGLHWYWMGTLPGCPMEQLWIGSVDFPKMTEDVRRDGRGQTKRVAKIGSLRQLTIDQLERIEADLPNCVIRFDVTKEEDEAQRERNRAACDNEETRRLYDPVGGPGSDLDALDVARRKGHPIRIPTDKAIEEAKKVGHMIQTYSASTRDEPAADYIFMELCANQDRPQRSDFYPECIHVTDLEWPVSKE